MPASRIAAAISSGLIGPLIVMMPGASTPSDKTLAPVLLAGTGAALPVSDLARRPLDDEPIIVMEATALADLGRQGRPDEHCAGALGDLMAVDPATLDNAVRKVGGAGLILDATV